MTISTNRDSDRFIVRLPDGMRDRIKDAAAANNRSMNAEIVARLEESFEGGIGQLQVTVPNLSQSLQDLSKRVQEATEIYRSPEFASAMRALAKRMSQKPPPDDD